MSLKFFQPYELFRAVEKVRQYHRDTRQKSRSDFPQNDLISLLKRIEQTPSSEEAMELLAASLSECQVQALAAYIPGNLYGNKYDINKIICVVSHCMTPRTFARLWTGWQKFPDNEDLLTMLSDPMVLALGSPENFSLSSEMLEGWREAISERTLISVICHQYIQKLTAAPAGMMPQTESAHPPVWGRSLFYRKWAASEFLPEETSLFYRCFIYYLAQANIDEMEEMGDEAMAALLSNSPNAAGVRSAMMHLLSQDAERLKLFGGAASYFGLSKTFEVIQKLFGVPDIKKFSGEQRAFENYLLWYNFIQIKNVFRDDADPSRVEFWKQYLHALKGIPKRFHEKSLIVMDFGSCVAVEFESIGTLYIFSKEIYSNKIESIFPNRREEVIKGILWNNYANSPSVFSQAHYPGIWQKAARAELLRWKIHPANG